MASRQRQTAARVSAVEAAPVNVGAAQFERRHGGEHLTLGDDREGDARFREPVVDRPALRILVAEGETIPVGTMII